MFDLLEWLKLLNALLIPIVIFIVKMRDEIRDAHAAITSHAELDAVKFGEHRRDLDRIEQDVKAAHRRLDRTGAPAASHESAA